MLRLLWAAPYSLIGLVLCLGFRRRRFIHGMLLCEGAHWPRKLGWRYRAITFGHVVLCVDDIDDRVLAHEVAHVRQYETWGPFFVPAYVIAALWAALRRRHPYRDNHFEVAARAEVSGDSPGPR